MYELGTFWHLFWNLSIPPAHSGQFMGDGGTSASQETVKVWSPTGMSTTTTMSLPSPPR